MRKIKHLAVGHLSQFALRGIYNALNPNAPMKSLPSRETIMNMIEASCNLQGVVNLSKHLDKLVKGGD